MKLAIRSKSKARLCPYCHEALEAPLRPCYSCGSVLHKDCAGELSVCPTLGCSRPVLVGPLLEEVEYRELEPWKWFLSLLGLCDAYEFPEGSVFLSQLLLILLCVIVPIALPVIFSFFPIFLTFLHALFWLLLGLYLLVIGMRRGESMF